MFPWFTTSLAGECWKDFECFFFFFFFLLTLSRRSEYDHKPCTRFFKSRTCCSDYKAGFTLASFAI